MPHSFVDSPALIAVEQVFLWFLLYSFVGWLWETCLNIVQKKRFVDRGILNGPLCPIYGFGAALAIFALDGEHSLLAIFLSSGVMACTLEYITSWGIEKLFHMRLWDYSNKPFNINGRVYLNGFLFFAAGCTVVKEWVQPWVSDMLERIPPLTLVVTSAVLFTVLMVDVAVTLAGLISMNSRLGHVEKDIKELKKRQIAQMDVHITAADERLDLAKEHISERLDSAKTSATEKLDTAREEVRAREVARRERNPQAERDYERNRARVVALKQRIHKGFTYQQRRLIAAYPSMKSYAHPRLVEELREEFHLNKKKRA